VPTTRFKHSWCLISIVLLEKLIDDNSEATNLVLFLQLILIVKMSTNVRKGEVGYFWVVRIKVDVNLFYNIRLPIIIHNNICDFVISVFEDCAFG